MVYNKHPFLNSFAEAGAFNVLPPQMVSIKRKRKKRDANGVSEWEKMNMDALETIARMQYENNRSLLENYKLVNGEFIPQDYLDCEDCDQYLDPLKELVKDGSIPKWLKHYDILSSPVNMLVNELSEIPYTMTIVGKGDPIQSEKEQEQTSLLQEYIYSTLDQKLNQQLVDSGVDLYQEFDDPKQQQEFQDQVSQQKDAMTPTEVKEYMQYSYRHIAELWGEYELEDQKERYNLKKLRNDEYRDLLISGRRFRHLNVTKEGLEVESWNPLNTFYQKSEEVQYTQHGDYAGKIYVASIPYIIDRFGKKLSEKQLQSLEHTYQSSTSPYAPVEDLMGNKINYLSNYGVPYNTALPSLDPSINRVAKTFDQVSMSGTFLNQLYGGAGYTSDFYTSNMCVVVEAYWKTQRKLGRLCWYNPETLQKEITLVDEDFIVPEYVKEIKTKNLESEPEINTIVWTWVNQLYKGKKINTYNAQSNESSIYFDIEPCEYQYKSPLQISKVEIPVYGQIVNSRNANPVSFVDLNKPLQFVYNIAMNKAVKYFEVSILPFLIMDIANMPNQKDWGGEDGQSKLEKYFQAGQAAGVVPKDSSPTNNNVQASKLAEVVDIDMTSRIIASFNVANSIKQMAMSNLGFTPERMGDVKGTDTATGINTSVAKSFSATAHWFNEFMECEKQIIKAQLDAAQWVQAQGTDITALNVKSDFSQSWLRFSHNNFNLYDLHIYVSNSQEEKKTLESYKQLAIEMNTVDIPMHSRMEMLSMKSPERIKKIIQMEEEKAIQRAQRINDLKQQEIAAKDEQEKLKLQQERELEIMKMENELKKAWITSRGYLDAGEQDIDSSGVPDAFEFAKFQEQSENNLAKMSVEERKLKLEEEKKKSKDLEIQQKMLLEQQKLALEKQRIQQTATNVKVMDKGKYKG